MFPFETPPYIFNSTFPCELPSNVLKYIVPSSPLLLLDFSAVNVPLYIVIFAKSRLYAFCAFCVAPVLYA